MILRHSRLKRSASEQLRTATKRLRILLADSERSSCAPAIAAQAT